MYRVCQPTNNCHQTASKCTKSGMQFQKCSWVITPDAHRLGAPPQTSVPDWESENVATLGSVFSSSVQAHWCSAVSWYGSGIVVQNGSRAESAEPGAVKQRTRPHSLVSWRTCPSYAADTVSSLQLRAGHSVTGRHTGAADRTIVCSRFRKSLPSYVRYCCDCHCLAANCNCLCVCFEYVLWLDEWSLSHLVYLHLIVSYVFGRFCVCFVFILVVWHELLLWI